MKSQGYLFSDINELPEIIQNASVSPEGELFCLIHTTKLSETDVVDMLAVLEKELPGVNIAGTTAPQVIYYGKLYDSRSLIEFIEPQNTEIQTEVFDLSVNTPATLSQKISEFMIRPSTRVMLNFFSGGFEYMPEYLAAISPKIVNDVKIGGGLVADDAIGQGFVFTKKGIFHDCLLAVSFHNPEIYSYAGMSVGMEVIHECYEMTETDDTYVTAIDGYPAVDWLKSILGVDGFIGPELAPARMTDNVLINFPFEFDDERGVATIAYYDPESARLCLYNKRPAKNQKFRIAYINADSIAASAANLCSDLSRTPIELLLCYSCMMRAGLEECCAEWELAPFVKAGICGCLMMGEIGTVPELRGNRALTEACTILTIAENRRYISINAGLLTNRPGGDPHRDIWNHILRFQNRSFSEKNDILKHAIIDMKIDPDYYDSYKDFPTKRQNLKRFIKDNENEHFDKVCLVMVERGNLALTHFGEDVYGKIIAKNIAKFESYIEASFPDKPLPIYVYDENSFIIAAGADTEPQRFLSIMQELFIKFGTINIISLSYTCIHRFIAVRHENSERILEELKVVVSRHSQTPDRFIVYETAEERSETLSDAFKKIKLITDAIENDGIVPYFQPIYDNQTGRIEKFEALIRIKGADGRIYFPGQFLESAKEYRLYLQLSEIMIGKVFDLFEHRDDTVSINLSAYDINSPRMRNMIYSRLEKLERPDHFIFEVLESEEFRDFEVLTHFIEKVRRYGVGIAIDDFGAGFSNLLEIAKISPNFIKIDGQIVREVVESEIHRKIMDAILHLAKSFNIELIAEYIENAALQAYAKGKGVRYSQGYFFSQPIPYSSLEEFSAKYNSNIMTV